MQQKKICPHMVYLYFFYICKSTFIHVDTEYIHTEVCYFMKCMCTYTSLGLAWCLTFGPKLAAAFVVLSFLACSAARYLHNTTPATLIPRVVIKLSIWDSKMCPVYRAIILFQGVLNDVVPLYYCQRVHTHPATLNFLLSPTISNSCSLVCLLLPV